MGPLSDYYLCTRNGDTDLVAVLLEGDGALDGYESVRKLEYWQALQWVDALWELERAMEEDDDLLSVLAALFSEARGGAIGNSYASAQAQRGMI